MRSSSPAYPDEVDHQFGILLDQMLWDRGENDGYAAHLTSNPYPHTKAKKILMFEAFGDHQVTNIATEVMARTVDVKLRRPAWRLAGRPTQTILEHPAHPTYPYRDSA